MKMNCLVSSLILTTCVIDAGPVLNSKQTSPYEEFDLQIDAAWQDAIKKNPRRLDDQYLSVSQVAKLVSDDGKEGDGFGDAISILDNLVVITAPYRNNRQGAVFVFKTEDEGESWQQTAEITAFDGEDDDEFGRYSVMLLANNALAIGAPYDDDKGEDAGAVYIFYNVDGGEEISIPSKLYASSPNIQDRFSWQVVASESGILYVGGRGTGDSVVDVFTPVGENGEYTRTTTIQSDDFQEGDVFGQSMFAFNNLLIVRSSKRDEERGAVYIFLTEDSGSSFEQVAMLQPNDLNEDDEFGEVTITQNYAVVCTAKHNDETGACYAYQTSDSGKSWYFTTKFTSRDVSTGGRFGTTVVALGNYLLVSAQHQDAVYFFRTLDYGRSFVEVTKIVGSEAREQRFGSSIALSSTSLIIGADEDYNDQAVQSGAAYAYRIEDSMTPEPTLKPTFEPTTPKPTTTPYEDEYLSVSQVAKLVSDDGKEGDGFGDAISILDNLVVITAPYRNNRQGAVFVFKTEDEGESWQQTAEITAFDGEDDDEFGRYSVMLLANNALAIGAPYDDDKGEDAGAVYIFYNVDGGEEISIPSKLYASSPNIQDRFSWQVVASESGILYVGGRGTGDSVVDVFTPVGQNGEYTRTTTIQSDDFQEGDVFGQSMFAFNNLLIVRSSKRDEERGAVYIFLTEDSGSSFEQVAMLQPNDLNEDDEFGEVTITQNYAVVCTAKHNDETGACYAYQTSDSGKSWYFTTKFTSRDVSTGGRFGTTVVALGNYLLVSAQHQDAVYFFRTLDYGRSFVEVTKIVGSEAREQRFGSSIALSSTSLIIGADEDYNDQAVQSGAAYAYRIEDSMTPEPTLKPTLKQTLEPTLGPTLEPTLESTLEPTREHTTPNPTTAPNNDDEDDFSGTERGDSSSDNNSSRLIVIAVVLSFLFASGVVYCLWRSWHKSDSVTKSSKKTAQFENISSTTELEIPPNPPSPNLDLPMTPPPRSQLSVEKRKQKQQKAENASAARANAFAVADALCEAGRDVPLIGVVCAVAKGILSQCDSMHKKCADITAAGSRVCNTIEVLSIIVENSSKLQEDAAKTLVERNMRELHEKLCDFQEAILSFNEKGWLKRKWHSIAHSTKLTTLDADIVASLDQVRMSYQLANDRRITSLLEVQTYDLELAMGKKIDSLVSEIGTISRQDAAQRLAEDDVATSSAARLANVGESELLIELRESMATVKTDLGEIRAALGRKTKVDKAREKKLDVLDTEIQLDSMESKPFARGGQAQIHLAVFHGQTVALKLVSLDCIGGMERNRLVSDLTREVGIMTRLRSPLIVQMYGIVTKDPRFFGMALEYLPGGSLRARLDDKSGFPDISVKQQRSWCISIAHGMKYLYANNVSHRDLKCNNILLSSDNGCKISDFGLSKCEELRTRSTRGNSMVGTVPFMAPELLIEAQHTEKSDVYSYAMCIFEIVTRDSPWKGLNDGQIAMKMVRNERPSLPEDVPSDLANMARACWTRDPGSRPSFSVLIKKYFDLLPKGGTSVESIDSSIPFSDISSQEIGVIFEGYEGNDGSTTNVHFHPQDSTSV